MRHSRPEKRIKNIERLLRCGENRSGRTVAGEDFARLEEQSWRLAVMQLDTEELRFPRTIFASGSRRALRVQLRSVPGLRVLHSHQVR